MLLLEIGHLHLFNSDGQSVLVVNMVLSVLNSQVFSISVLEINFHCLCIDFNCNFVYVGRVAILMYLNLLLEVSVS